MCMEGKHVRAELKSQATEKKLNLPRKKLTRGKNKRVPYK